MKQVFQIIVSFVVGIIIGYFIGCHGKDVKIVEKEKLVPTIDTFIKEIKAPIPKPEIKYYPKHDSIFLVTTDSFYKELIKYVKDSIPVNVYRDTLSDDSYRLEYEILTAGELLSFKPTFTTYHSTETVTKYVKPKWMVSGAVSNQLNYKLGVGYFGWTVEGEFKKGLNQIYIGKQFNF